jgi:hypothetical protein
LPKAKCFDKNVNAREGVKQNLGSKNHYWILNDAEEIVSNKMLP